MGSVSSKRRSKSCNKVARHVREKLRVVHEEEVMELVCKRQQESRAHRRQTSIFAAKEAEWKRERKRLKDEARRLRKKLEEKEEIIYQLEEDLVATVESDREWQAIGASLLVEKMREEQAHREEAVEKWKCLYLAIKVELDNLIHRARQGERLWEEDVMEGLQRELKAKEEIVEALRAQISDMENEGSKREREVDILKQSLRIMSNSKRGFIRKNLSRSLHL